MVLRVSALAFCFCSALAANATLIDFENLTGGTLSSNGYATLYSSTVSTGGFTFTCGDQYAAWTPASTSGGFANYTGSVALFSNAGVSSATTITRTGGGAFDFLGISVANDFLQTPPQGYPVSVMTFTGNLAAGGTVMRTYSILQSNALQNLTLTGFTGLTSVVMSSTSVNANVFQFDNVNVQAVPEPASVAALGMGALAILRRRRRATR